MQKREKILAGCAALTLAVAAVLSLTNPAAKRPERQETPGAALRTAEKAVETDRLTNSERYCLALLAEKDVADPFYGGTATLTQEDDGQNSGDSAVVYSGYIKAGPHVLAVINGIEYAVGDALADGGYTLKGIDKNSVLLERTDDATGRRLTRRVPLVEDDTDKIRIRVVKKR